jgi:hypothetical protein
MVWLGQPTSRARGRGKKELARAKWLARLKTERWREE